MLNDWKMIGQLTDKNVLGTDGLLLLVIWEKTRL